MLKPPGLPDLQIPRGSHSWKKPRRTTPAGLFDLLSCLKLTPFGRETFGKFKSLAVTYSCMPEGHTTIGAERFHFRVRNGIGWFPLALAARQTGSRRSKVSRPCRTGIRKVVSTTSCRTRVITTTKLHRTVQNRPKRIGCYMVKPHGQLVLVSSMHCCTYTPSLSTS